MMMRLFQGTPWDRLPTCDHCGKETDQCRCDPPSPATTTVPPPENQKLQIRVEKRRKGKTVTVIKGLQFGDLESKKTFLASLKDHCGAGGRSENDVFEIQGDQSQKLLNLLAAKGYRVSHC